jgi:DNA ligase (NAD+)
MLRCDKGELKQAITRGREGIIGEGVISWENFKKINYNLEQPYTHLRNLAAGSARKRGSGSLTCTREISPKDEISQINWD